MTDADKERGSESGRVSRRVTCAQCGHERDPSIAENPDRPPCEECGHEGLAVEIGVAEEISVASEVELGISPSEYERDVSRRWAEIDGEIRRLESPISEYANAEVLALQRLLHNIFIELQGMREAAIHAGLSKAAVDRAINANQNGMALAHDVGNLVKPHVPFAPNRSRTGTVPVLKAPTATRPGTGGKWRFQLGVSHGAIEHDAVEVARRAVDQWGQLLRAHGLL